MFGKTSHQKVVAIVDIGSASVGVAIIKSGTSPEVLAHAREVLSSEERGKDALRVGITQALVDAGTKALDAYAKGKSHPRISLCYAIVGGPWSRSFGGTARQKFEKPASVSDAMISGLAKQALADQKDIDPANLLEANVSRILLNGYPTSEPAGKRAQLIDIYTLVSDCDPSIKGTGTEVFAKMFPGATVVWRSSARAIMAAAKLIDPTETSFIVEIGDEATDLISLRDGSIARRVLLEQGVRQIVSSLAKGKPVEETITLIEMLEKEQCETDACKALEDSIAKTEPELVHVLGESLAKLATPRKLPDDLVLMAPPALTPWLSRFFARIDFTQFTTTARPFSVRAFSTDGLSALPRNDPSFLIDTGLCVASNLVNMELSS